MLVWPAAYRHANAVYANARHKWIFVTSNWFFKLNDNTPAATYPLFIIIFPRILLIFEIV